MKTIKDVCEAHYAPWVNDCSGFLKAVAADLRIQLSGQANHIIDVMALPPWTQLGGNAKKAAAMAGERNLVVGGLKDSPNGHVVVIVPGEALPYPMAYWGSLHHNPGYNKSINWAWVKSDLPKVTFYAQAIPSPIDVQ
jgi:hypothetical protein